MSNKNIKKDIKEVEKVIKKIMKKYLFPIVPINPTYFPTLAVPSLIAQLREKGFQVSVIDMNMEFLQKIYTKDYLENAVKIAKEQYEELKKIKEEFIINKDSYESIILKKKFDVLDDFINNHQEIGDRVPVAIEKALKILKTKELFYNPKLLKYANQVLQYANRIVCLPYIPFDLYRLDMTYYEDVKKIIFDEKQNIFLKYFEEQIDKIIEQRPDYVGISITFVQQLVPGLTLAYLLKKYTNAHINIGGNYFSRLIDYIPNYKDFFDIFVDSISYGEGENSIVKLAQYIEGEIDITEVPQLIYMDKSTREIKKNKVGEPVVLSQIQSPDFSDFDLDKYLLPEKALPLQIQRGCYWNKCIFCEFSFFKRPSVKKIPQIVEELKYYKEKYGVSNYFIADDAVHPSVLEKLSDAIIESELEFRFSASLRLEKEFTLELLKKMYKAGFRAITWGVESASKKILKHVNKGIVLNEAIRVLKNANKVGLSNRLSFMINCPTATYEDDLETLNFLKKYSKYIQHFLFFRFVPMLNSIISNNPSKYGIELVKDKLDSRISVEFDYVQEEGMSIQEKKMMYEIFLEYEQKEKYKYYFESYYHILYANHYDLKQLNKILLNNEKRGFLSKVYEKFFEKTKFNQNNKNGIQYTAK